MERYIGKLLDNRYEILEVIGQGGMAVVFKAKCHRLNRLVAVKVLKPDLADDAEFRRRFHDESQAVAMLSHPNIVSVYDVSRGSDLEYIVMELIDGITLKQYMERRGQLNWREALHFITQIMRGLSHAHSRGIIHRDIKPHNIMVLRDGSVKVADFGIACLSTQQTMNTKEAMGSVHYISPEQAKGGRADARSDIYSAGVVLYEMLTNRLPFEGDSPVSIAIQHFSAVPLNPREVNPDIPQALELICMKAMAPQIDQRYANADEMIHDLEEFRKNPEINFDYQLDQLRIGAITDEPTQPINARELHHMTEDRRREEEPRGSRWKKILAVVLGIILSGFIIYGLYTVILDSFQGDPTPEHVVPNLVGMTLEEAQEDPRVKGIFELKVIASRSSDEYDVNVIMEQDPQADRVKKSDFVIEVTVSEGIPTAVMPPVVDYERTMAKLILDNLNLDLTYEFREEYSEQYAAGHVISTDPRAGDPISEGDTIVIRVSKGKELKPVNVIRFINMTREDAESNARTLGLVPVFVEEPSEIEAGLVISQNIAEGTSVLEGTTIELTVSSGMPEEQLPPDTPEDPTGETGETQPEENPE